MALRTLICPLLPQVTLVYITHGVGVMKHGGHSSGTLHFLFETGSLIGLELSE